MSGLEEHDRQSQIKERSTSRSYSPAYLYVLQETESLTSSLAYTTETAMCAGVVCHFSAHGGKMVREKTNII